MFLNFSQAPLYLLRKIYCKFVEASKNTAQKKTTTNGKKAMK